MLGREDPGAARAAAAGGLTLAQAETRGLAQVVEGGGRVRVLTDTRRPVTLRLRLRHARFTVRALPSGPRFTYGPVSGTAQIRPGGRSAAPAVRVGNRRIRPKSHSGHKPARRHGPARHRKPAKRLRFAAKPRWAGTTIVARVAAPARGALISTVRIAGAKIASRRTKVTRAGVVVVRFAFPVRFPVPVTLAVTLRTGAGRTQVVSAAVRT
jgi:hypothetical protein